MGGVGEWGGLIIALCFRTGSSYGNLCNCWIQISKSGFQGKLYCLTLFARSCFFCKIKMFN